MTRSLCTRIFIWILGVSTCSASASADPPIGTISTFGPDLANTQCANPEGLAIDPRGNFYTAVDGDGAPVGTVCVFDSAGAFTRTIPIAAGPASVVALVGLLFEAPDKLFVLDTADGNAPNGRLLKVDVNTGAVTALAGGFAFPNAIAEDDRGRLYVSDSALGTINRISQDGSQNVVWASGPLFLTNGFPPVGINDLAFDLADENLYATNTGDSRVLRVPVRGDGSSGPPQIFADGATIDARQNTTGALHGADGLAFDVKGNLYIAANQVNEIQVLSPRGRLIARYAGSGPTQLDFPATLVFRGDGPTSRMRRFSTVAPIRGSCCSKRLIPARPSVSPNPTINGDAKDALPSPAQGA
jgi:sugar lactone lactonase YvrE